MTGESKTEVADKIIRDLLAENGVRSLRGIMMKCTEGQALQLTKNTTLTDTLHDEIKALCNSSLKYTVAGNIEGVFRGDKTQMLDFVRNYIDRHPAMRNTIKDPAVRAQINPETFMNDYAKAALAGKTSMDLSIGGQTFPITIRPSLAYAFSYAYTTYNPDASSIKQDLDAALKSFTGTMPTNGVLLSALAGAGQAKADARPRVSANDNELVTPTTTAAGYVPAEAAAAAISRR